jgi:MtN3 and saliva related transmembrane protein
MMMTEAIGWFAAVVLLSTIGRQVYTQWRDGSSKGLSRWLFIGQITASIAFIVYSWLLANWVFVVTNALMLITAALGQWIYLSNKAGVSISHHLAIVAIHRGLPSSWPETLNDEL